MSDVAKEEDYEGTNLAFRLRERKERRPAVTRPLWLIPPLPLLMLAALCGNDKPAAESSGNTQSVTASRGNSQAALVLCLFAGASLVAAIGTREVVVLHEPMPEGPDGQKLAVDMIRSSRSKLEREHISLGWLANTCRRVPFLLHEKLCVVMHILGPAGSMKTFKILAAILCQIMAMGNRSVLVCDMKGSPRAIGNALFWILVNTARALKMDVLYYSLNEREAGCLVETLSSEAFRSLNPKRQSRTVAESHGIEHGDGWSKGYYGGVGAKLVNGTLRLFHERRRVPSYLRFAAFFTDKAIKRLLNMSRRDFDNASNAANVIENMSPYPHLNTTGEEGLPPSMYRCAINVDRLIRRPTLIFLKLPASIDAVAGRNLVRFYIQLLMQRLQDWEGDRVKYIYVAVDEAQEVLQHRSMRLPIVQGRSGGLRFIFAHQTLEDLKWDDLDMMGPVTNNASVTFTMGARDTAGRERHMGLGGERKARLEGGSITKTKGPTGTTTSRGKQWREIKEKVVDANLLNELNSDPSLAMVSTSPASGFTAIKEPALIEVPFSMEEEEFEELDEKPWPGPIPGSTMTAIDLAPFVMPPPPLPEQPALAAQQPPQPTQGPSRSEKRKGKNRSTPEEIQEIDELRSYLKQMRDQTP
jgi:hypothetical protein